MLYQIIIEFTCLISVNLNLLNILCNEGLVIDRWLVLDKTRCEELLVVIKLPYLKSTMLCSKLSKGMGHNYYGEPAWPNDILYIFPIVIFGIRSYILGLAIHEPLNISAVATPFATPLEILPEWYLFPTFNLLRILSDKFIGICWAVLFTWCFINYTFWWKFISKIRPFHAQNNYLLLLKLYH